MPTYEYACSSCDTTHDIVQKMTDLTLTECPACGEPTLRCPSTVALATQSPGPFCTPKALSGDEPAAGVSPAP